MTSAPGSAPASRPGRSSFERRTPEPITATSMSSTRESTSSRHAAGQPDRRDPAVLHPGLLDRPVHRQERALADVEGPLDHVVDVGPGVGADQAGGHPLLAVAPAADHHAVGAGVHARGRRPRSSRRCRRPPGRSRPRPARARAPTPRARPPPAAPAARGGRGRAGTPVGRGWARVMVPIQQQPTQRQPHAVADIRAFMSFPPIRSLRFRTVERMRRGSAAAGHRPPRCSGLPARAHAGVVPAGDRARCRRRRAGPRDDRRTASRSLRHETRDQRHHRRGRRTRSSRTGARSRSWSTAARCAAGSARTSRWPSSRRCGRSSGCPSGGRATPAGTASSRSPPSTSS